MNDYSGCYVTLGVTPDTEWGALRARYRRLMGQWHPDRFSADSADKAIAEERSKQITLAYKALANYRRHHGELPPMEPEAVVAQGSIRNADPTPDRTGFKDHAETSTMDATGREHASHRPRLRLRVAVALTAFAAALYFAFSYQDPRAPDGDSPEPGAVDPDVAAQKPPPAESSREPAGISIGSTLGEVYAVQGVPTLTQGDIWHYGQSQIHFVRGKVVSWTEHPDNPLRIARDQSAPLLGGTFDVGSTKNEVRAIQGTPVTETDTVWDYAPSRVFFEHNRVVRWEESPMQPLRVAR